jgi:hypothetical protein
MVILDSEVEARFFAEFTLGEAKGLNDIYLLVILNGAWLRYESRGKTKEIVARSGFLSPQVRWTKYGRSNMPHDFAPFVKKGVIKN